MNGLKNESKKVDPKKTVFGACLTQSARFNKWHMKVLIRRNAFSFVMASFTIWSFFQNTVKGNLKEF